MFEVTGLLYTVRLRLRIRVRPKLLPYGPDGSGVWERDIARRIADDILNTLDDDNPISVVGVQWQDIYYSLERVNDPTGVGR